MTGERRPPSQKISVLVSDVDGTLVTDDKELLPSTLAAVAELRDRGIGFAIISSRPPRGVEFLIETLGITTPVIGFNGGIVLTPELKVIETHFIPPTVGRRAVDLLTAHGVQPWVFTPEEWLLRDIEAPYVPKEKMTVRFMPTLVGDFAAGLEQAGKIVGVSADFPLLARCEIEIRDALGYDASVVRSQNYYLDITSPQANKGAAVLTLSRLLNVPIEEIAVIGDGGNDVAMFAEAGLSIAMGNARPDVQKQADFVTSGNGANGFAMAVERFILDRAAPANATS